MSENLEAVDIKKLLIVSGWNFSNDIENYIRFREHLNLIDFDTNNRILNSVIFIKEDD